VTSVCTARRARATGAGVLWLAALPVAVLPLAACGGPDAPEHPTWADVQPIVRAECSSCHGATAAVTGAGHRFDFYDMTTELCGPAAQALDPTLPLAHALSPAIWDAITTTTDRPYTRPRMPPEPAPYLADREWKTIRHWLDDGAPKGDRPSGNTPARIQIYGDLAAAGRSLDRSLDITVVVEDPDGDPVVGVLTLGDVTLKMDRAGAFTAHLDTSTWPAGPRSVGTVLCDGWSSVHYLLGTMQIAHAP
jgi:hypothetical protein